MKKGIKILIWILSVTFLVAITVFVSVKRSNATCTKITINISDSANLKTLSKQEILDILEPNGKKLTGKPIKEINVSNLEKKLKRYPLIKKAEVFLAINGELQAKIIPRVPIVRICNRLNQYYCIDIEGFLMPIPISNQARLVVANGNISYKPRFDSIVNIYIKNFDKRIDIKTLRDIHTIATFIHSNPFWDAQIQQIYINNEDEIELSTLVGEQNVVFGSIENYEEKFRNLEAFYKKGLPVSGWNSYKEINLKYKNQIVCTKSE